jgi:hypothetical protein
MSQAKGYMGRTTLFFEPTYKGTPSPKNGIIIPFNKNTIQLKQGIIKTNTILNRRDPARPGLGRKNVDGTLEVPSCYRTMGYILKAMLGAPMSTGGITAGFVTGGTGVTTTIGTWNAITDGSFSVTINGVARDITGIDLSLAADMDAVAAAIQVKVRAATTGGFTLATVAWQVGTTNFKITSGTLGVASSVSALSAAATGTDISGASLMKCHAAVAVLTAGTGRYTHVFKVTNTEQPSLKVEKGFTDIGKYYLADGIKISKLNTAYGIGDSEHIHTIEILGSTEVESDSEYDSAATTLVLSRMNDYEASIKEGGSTVANISNFEFAIELGLDPEQFGIGGGNSRTSLPEGQVALSGKLVAFFTDTVILAKAMAGTKSSIEIKSENTDGDSLTYNLAEIMYSVTTPAIEGPTGVKISPDFSAFYENAAGNSSLIATLVNDVPSYA